MRAWIWIIPTILMIAFGITLSLDSLGAPEPFVTGTTTTVITMDGTEIDSSNATTNNGTATNMDMKHGETANQRILLKADLSSIPSDHAIIAAHIHTRIQKALSVGDSLISIGAYRVMNAWNETEATWNNRTTATAWNLAGAKKTYHNWNPSGGSDTTFNDTAYDITSWPQSVFSTPTVASVGDTIRWDVTFAVRKWHSGQWENNGLMLAYIIKPDWVSSAIQGPVVKMKSDDDASADNRPKLTVTSAPLRGRGVAMGRRRAQ